MEQHIVKILSIGSLSHDVNKYTVERPAGYTFHSGQATEVSINKPGWENEKRPFTFTSINAWEHLEFTIKSYQDHNSVTAALSKLKPGEELILHDVWGAITYKGKGIFIAGGAGVTPFISIFRQLYADHAIGGNQLIFSNKTKSDIILKAEFEKMLGENFVNVLTREKAEGYENRRIDEAYIKEHVKDFNRHFYVCGPEKFTNDIQGILLKQGAAADAVIIEK